jgi:hypothetical protein
MKTALVTAVTALLILGCTAIKQAEENRPIKNPRIMYRDLTTINPAHFQLPDAPEIPREPTETIDPNTRVIGVGPTYFVAFADDSYRLDSTALKDFIAATPAEALILVVGHSHGKSAVGTLQLASKRAQSVSDCLQGRGYHNVHVMASWGSHSIDFAPSRGVHLYVLETGTAKGTLPIVFARTIEERSNEDFKVCHETVRVRAAESRLGNV